MRTQTRHRATSDRASRRDALIAHGTTALQVAVVLLTAVLLGLRLSDVVSFRTVVVTYLALVVVMGTTFIAVPGLMRIYNMSHRPSVAITAVDVTNEGIEITLRDEYRVSFLDDSDSAQPNSKESEPVTADDSLTRRIVASPNRPVFLSATPQLLGSLGSVIVGIGLAALTSVLMISTYVLSHAAASKLPLAVHIWLLIGPCLLVIGVAIGLGEDERRRKVVMFLSSAFGRVWTLGGIVAVFFALTGYFSLGSAVLVDHGTIELTSRTEAAPDLDAIMKFFIWSFCEDIPLLDITDTLRWRPPLEYEDPGFGWLVLIYKLAVIVPIVATFRIYWKSRRAEASA